MRRPLVLAAALAALLGGAALGQTFLPWQQPEGAPITGSVLNCATGPGRTATACGIPASPLSILPAPNAPARAVVQSGDWRLRPATGTPVAGAVASLGTASAVVLPASPTRTWFLVQNPAMVGAAANGAGIWCNPGGAATTAPPSVFIPPGGQWTQGTSPGFVLTSAIACVASADASPIAAWHAP